MTDTYNVSNPDKPIIVKDPQAVLDYTEDWTDWLADVGDTLVSATVTPAAADDGSNLTVVQSALTLGNKAVVAWLSGGVVGKTYRVVFHITTASTPARQDDRSIFIKVKDR